MKHNRWLLFFTFSALILLPLDSSAVWQKYTVNSSPIAGTFWCLTVTAGRNGSSTNYLYASSSNQNVYEYYWDGLSWSGAAIGVAETGYEAHGLAVGNGRNDGTTHLYAGSSYGDVADFFFNGSAWGSTVHFTPNYDCHSLAVGPGRNSGTNYVYAASISAVVCELFYNGTGYDYANLTPAGSSDFWGVALGDGRHDGTQRVYAASTDHNIYEYYYNGASWVRTNVATEVGAFYSLAIGPGSHVGSDSIFGGYESGLAYEYFYDGIGWQRSTLSLTGSSGDTVCGLSLGGGRNDGISRVYADCKSGHTFEFTWNGLNWNSLDMGTTTGGVPHGVCVGPGRGGNNSVFVGADDGFIYEYHWVPDTPTATPTFTATATNTPTLTATPSFTPTSTVSGTGTPTITPTFTPTPTFSPTPSCTPTHTISPTPTCSPTATPTPTFTVTVIPYLDLSAVVVYPNPCRTQEKTWPQIKFGYLPQQVTIRIYALTGNLVRTLEKNNQQPTLAWDLKNEHGYALASGVYIFIVRDDHGREFRGKVALLH